jgi:NYN domain
LLPLNSSVTCTTIRFLFFPAVRFSGRTGGASVLFAPEAVRVAVFIDWQNVYKAARRAFGLERMPVERGNFSPYRLGLFLAAANGRGDMGQLVAVEIHRGLPSQRLDWVGYSASRRQAAMWKAENSQVVQPKLRPLQYRRRSRLPVEKGIDVALAVSAIEFKLNDRCDVAIVFSHDTDLLPVPEAIAELAGPGGVETASWSSPNFAQRLRPKVQVAHHSISRRIFEAIETPVNYARRPDEG